MSRGNAQELGRRCGSTAGQEFVIGGYTPGARNFDTLIFGYFEGDRLIYAGRTRSGSTPATRDKLWGVLHGLETPQCPFVNLPEAHPGRWGQGLTAEKMRECHWLEPVLVAEFEFVEWTPDEEAASHYTRSSSRTTKVSDHASLSPAHGS